MNVINVKRSSLAGVAQCIECWPANQRVAGSLPSQGMMWTLASSVHGVVDETKQIQMDYRSPVEKKGWHSHCLKGRPPCPLSQGESASTPALTGFYWLSNSIHQRRFSFIMLRSALGNYFLQITKERMLLITFFF